MPTDNLIIQINVLRKTYKKSQQPALDGLDLSISKGEVFGLLGPNGAGKTTTISILCGLLKPSAGSIQIKNKNLSTELIEIKKTFWYSPSGNRSI